MGKGMRAGKKSGGGGSAANMQKQLAQVQAIQRKMEEKQEEIDQMEVTTTSGGGAVSVTVSGKKEISRIDIQKDVVDPEDVEMLQDLIITAANEALRQMEEISNSEMNKITGGMGLGM